MKRLALIIVAVVIAAVSMMPASSYALDSQQVGYILPSNEGVHLTDSKWCATTTADKSWPYSLANCNTGSGVISDFNKDTSSYVMFKAIDDGTTVNPNYTSTNGQPQYLKLNRYTIYVAEAGKKIIFYKGKDALGGTQYYFTTNGNTMRSATIRAEPNSDPDYKYNWTGSFASGAYNISVGSTFTMTSVNGGRGFVIGNDRYDSEVGAINVDYAASWDFAHMTNHVPYGTDGAPGCGTLDIGCWVGKLTSGFTNGIKELFGLMVDAFKWLWVPDGSVIKSSFDDLNTFMNNKLGFLAYPYTFLSNLLNSFNSSSSWCNSTSCVKNFGNLFGHAFTVNLGQTAATMPTLWTWFTAMLRGILVLTLILAIRQKYRQVTAK